LGISNKLQQTKRSTSGLPCSVGVLLSELEPEDREALQDVLTSEKSSTLPSNRQIFEILKEEGHYITFYAVGNHRRKQCRCFSSNAEVEGEDK